MEEKSKTKAQPALCSHACRMTEIAAMDRYWRAANYLSVGQIYLLDNPLLKESLTLRAYQAAASRPLGDDTRAQFYLCPSQSRDQEI